MKEYYQRVSDKVLLEHLESKGAVLIEGAKWCGKTTSAKHIAKSVIEMDRPDMTEQYQQMARINPSNLLEGKVPHLIDEWQIATNIWNAVRYEVDQRGEFGQFILTGSSVPAALDESMHTGTGRIVRMQMRPMSLFESKDSTGQVSLMDLFNKKDISAVDNHSIDEIAFQRHLVTQDEPPVDLLIRTSGEQRISNFLLWQIAYAELYFSDVLWPDFDEAEFNRAIACYQQRHRRFGGTE